ncbi:MAG: AAA family ATPase, partial [Bacteroidales bacterium]|nr:AAA family ATPase [Bacteroidales bacterium]
MGKILKNKVLHSLGIVYEKSKSCKLSLDFLKKIDYEVEFLKEYFNCNEIQILILSFIFVETYKCSYVDTTDIIDYFKCNPMELLKHNEEIDSLVEKGIIKRTTMKRGRFRKSADKNEKFVVNERVFTSILNNEKLAENTSEKFENIFELFESVYYLSEDRDEDKISACELKKEIRTTLNNNKKFEFVKRLLKYKFDDDNTFTFLYLIWEILATRSKSSSLNKIAEYLYDHPSAKLHYMQSFFNKKNQLLELDLVELEEDFYYNDADLLLTNNAKTILKESGINILVKKVNEDNIINPDKIKEKTLIYNSKEDSEIKVIGNFLKEDEFKKLQEKLETKKLSKGITALFYGGPGTGKTETVYQLAKTSGREIMYVDISSAKSMWFGQSEKVVRKIFTDYKQYSEQAERTPILLFNEADAIISKRKNIESSNVAQTENAMQNIILEELEKFDGIFIATTNLISNIDKAFERRFLFKLKFCKPDNISRAKIWKLKIPRLSINNCKKLAEQFDLTGGEIDNIIRKIEMYEIM